MTNKAFIVFTDNRFDLQLLTLIRKFHSNNVTQPLDLFEVDIDNSILYTRQYLHNEYDNINNTYTFTTFDELMDTISNNYDTLIGFPTSEKLQQIVQWLQQHLTFRVISPSASSPTFRGIQNITLVYDLILRFIQPSKFIRRLSKRNNIVINDDTDLSQETTRLLKRVLCIDILKFDTPNLASELSKYPEGSNVFLLTLEGDYLNDPNFPKMNYYDLDALYEADIPEAFNHTITSLDSAIKMPVNLQQYIYNRSSPFVYAGYLVMIVSEVVTTDRIITVVTKTGVLSVPHDREFRLYKRGMWALESEFENYSFFIDEIVKQVPFNVQNRTSVLSAFRMWLYHEVHDQGNSETIYTSLPRVESEDKLMEIAPFLNVELASKLKFIINNVGKCIHAEILVLNKDMFSYV